MLTRQELDSSLDAYPVEFLAVRESGVVVCGEFDLASLAIVRDDLRLQCERDLRGLLIHARMATIRLGQDEKQLGRLMAAGSVRLATIARAAAFLLGEAPGGPAQELLERLSAAVGDEESVLTAIWKLRDEKRPRFSAQQMAGLMKLLEAVVEKIDTLDSGGKS